MASVDLALYFLLRRHGLSSDARFFLLLGAEELHAHRGGGLGARIARQQQLPFAYETLRGRLREVVDSRVIVFWGDFLHSREYLMNIGKYLIRVGAAGTPAEASAMVLEHLYLRAQPDDVLSRCLVFGESLLFNRESDYHDRVYRQPFVRFMGGVYAAWMRDFYSAFRVATIRDTSEQVQLGVDCSLLLRPADVETLPRSDWDDRGVDVGATAGIFFGRSNGSQRRLGRFAGDLCRRMKVAAEWIPWGDVGSFPDRSREVARGFRGMRIHESPAPPLVGDLLAAIPQYRFVVTDTYHVCLNAWRSGVPAICVGDVTPRDAPWDVSAGWRLAWRDKRQVFFATFDAMDFFVHAAELGERKIYRERLDLLTELLTDEAVVAGIVERLHRQAEVSERGFVGALATLNA